MFGRQDGKHTISVKKKTKTVINGLLVLVLRLQQLYHKANI